ncbi:potassium-transporting ATPase subunit C [Streptomyces sp. NPDC048416]|uniref:potassium-transporting ATPase subunit C n=1 Tax=Streptomyces sp. NPDC048416 TaxID=3365546 RepID=UPI00372059FC
MNNNSLGNTARLLGAGLRALLVLTVVCGVIYPLVVTGVARLAFRDRADGSELTSGGHVVGSELIGQRYDLPKRDPGDPDEQARPDLRWFQPRPSNGLAANTLNTRYRLLVSGATNLSGDNEKLIEQVKEAKAAVVRDNSTPGHPVDPADVPADAVTSSGSGLDPQISPAYAELQVQRVAERNHLDVRQVERLVADATSSRILGFIGEPGVHVLKLNIALRELASR